jgi:hypothetical protein
MGVDILVPFVQVGWAAAAETAGARGDKGVRMLAGGRGRPPPMRQRLERILWWIAAMIREEHGPRRSAGSRTGRKRPAASSAAVAGQADAIGANAAGGFSCAVRTIPTRPQGPLFRQLSLRRSPKVQLARPRALPPFAPVSLAAVQYVMGMPLNPSMNQPYLSVTIQEFWSQRWA